MHAVKSRGRFRSWMIILVLLALTGLIATRFANLSALFDTLGQGHLDWILAGLILHLIYFGLYAVLYQVGFNAVGVRSRFSELVPVVFASIFVNTIAPSGGASSAALFIDDSVQRGESGSRTAVGMLLVLVVDLVTLLPIILIGVFYLLKKNALYVYDIIAVIFYILFNVLMMATIALARWRAGTLQQILVWLQNQINHVGGWFHRPQLLKPGWAEQNTHGFAEAALSIFSNSRNIKLAVGLGFILHLVNILGLYVLFIAYDQAVNLGTLLAGYSMGIVFWVIGLLPQGIGVTEGMMALVYTVLGIPRTKAIVIALAFRGFNFWLPLLLGILFLRKVRSFRVHVEE
ncbi:MAG: flippase-like domain-containing protein [Chloroflexi bacterium]|nr:flippase-like domain-containing protein [Chloroflexota bacterium]